MGTLAEKVSLYHGFPLCFYFCKGTAHGIKRVTVYDGQHGLGRGGDLHGDNLEQLWREQIPFKAQLSAGLVFMCALNPHQGPSGQLLGWP